MSLFKLIKLAIDALYAEAKGQDKSFPAHVLHHEVRQHLTSFSSNYSQLTEGNVDPIDYSSPTARIAYLYCYVGAHADYLYQALQEVREKLDGNLFHRSCLRVSCIGSGPGTDVFGVLKYLHENPEEPVAKVQARLFDRQPDWRDTRKALKLAYEKHPDLAGDSRLEVKTKTEFLDVWERETMKRARKACRGDLTILSYVVSEAYSQNHEAAARQLKKLLRRVRSNAYVLYVDNASSPLTKYFDDICRETGLNRLFGYSGDLTIAYSEEKSDLAPYDSRFDWSPKLKSNLCVRLLTKSA